MRRSRNRLVSTLASGFALSATCGVVAMSLIACSAAATKKRVKSDAGEVFEEDPVEAPLNPARPPDFLNEDSGAFDIGDRKGTNLPVDGGVLRPGEDAGNRSEAGLPDGGVVSCSGSLKPGDLRVVEIMIQSVAGSGDKAEWVEVQSTRPCKLNIKGLTVSSPRGTATDGVTISRDIVLPPFGTFVATGSSDPVVNHGLKGVVVSWDLSDVLKNDGDTINVKLGDTVIDTVTYPRFTTMTAGRSISFPLDCAWSHRSNWARWSYSFTYYGGTYQGTPNAPNNDVACF